MLKNSFFEIKKDKKEFLPLLLLADPDEKMLDKYLETGRVFAIRTKDTVVSVAVVSKVSDTVVELKNIATKEEFQNQGYATLMIKSLCEEYKAYETMIVGTSKFGILFYERQGFSFSHISAGFFKNYEPPVYENGELLIDMIYLKKELK